MSAKLENRRRSWGRRSSRQTTAIWASMRARWVVLDEEFDELNAPPIAVHFSPDGQPFIGLDDTAAEDPGRKPEYELAPWFQVRKHRKAVVAEPVTEAASPGPSKPLHPPKPQLIDLRPPPTPAERDAVTIRLAGERHAWGVMVSGWCSDFRAHPMVAGLRLFTRPLDRIETHGDFLVEIIIEFPDVGLRTRVMHTLDTDTGQAATEINDWAARKLVARG